MRSASETGGEEDTYRYRVARDQPVSEAVVTAVAEATGLRAVGTHVGGGEVLEPLYETVDPDALDALFRRSGEGVASPGTVAFTYGGHEVTVEGGEVVTVATK